MGNISKIRIQNTDYAIKDSRLPDGTSSQFVKGDGSLDSTSYVSSTNAVKNGDFILTNNASLTASIKQRVYDRSLQDTLFAANSRFVVTHKRYSSTDDSFINNLSTDIFKGTFSYYLNTVLDGEYGVLYIGNVAEDELSSTTTAANGIFTYPNGKIFMTFYSSMRPGEILEAKGWFRNDTTWRSLTVVANNINVYEIQVPNVNYLKAVRIKYSGSNLGSEKKTSLTDVAYIRYRDDFSERNLITKYPTAQRMYGNLTAPKFITSGGTSSQFVKGDGSLDSNTYATESYVQDEIGTLTDGTAASESGNVIDIGAYDLMKIREIKGNSQVYEDTVVGNNVEKLDVYDSNDTKKGSLALNLSELTGKVGGEGTSVTIFPDGLHGVGTVYDSLIVDDDGYARKAVKRMGSVDLGSLSWYFNNNGYFYGVITTGQARYDNMFVTSKYVYGTWSQVSSSTSTSDKVGTISVNNNRFNVRDSSYSTAADFKTAMSGVMLYYELATPIEYVLDTPVQCVVPVSKNGTVKQVPVMPDSTPMVMDVTYLHDTGGVIGGMIGNYATKEYVDDVVGDIETLLASI